MSEIRANTVSNAAGTGPATLTGQYAAKAWVNFDGTGTVAIRDSGNVSSITDNGIGDYTVNFISAFPNATFASQGSASTSSTNPNGIWTSGAGIATTTSRSVRTQNTNGANLDLEFAQGSFLGDLA